MAWAFYLSSMPGHHGFEIIFGKEGHVNQLVSGVGQGAGGVMVKLLMVGSDMKVAIHFTSNSAGNLCASL